MSSEAIVAILVALGTFLGAAGGFFAKSRLGDVIVSGSKREETAVGEMATALNTMTAAQHDRELRLLGLQEKALETVGKMSGAIQSFTLALQAHEHDMLALGEDGNNVARQILESVTDTQGEIREMAATLTDLAANMLKPEAEAAGD